MSPLSLIPAAYQVWAKLAAIGALVVAILAGVAWLRHTWMDDGRNEVRAEWAIEKQSIAQQSLKLSEQATRDTATLQANADKTTGAKNVQIARLNTDLHGALERLRERPERDSAARVPGDPSIGETTRGCTGAQLYRSDSEILARIGRDADELRINLKACYEQYDAAREAINVR